MRKKLAVPHHLYAAPLTYGLMRDESAVELVADLPAANALKLRNKDVDGAFITPIDYGRESSEYVIMPGIAAASRGESGAVGLFFHSGLNSLQTVAVDIGLTSEIVLTRIILAEKYNINPQFVPMMPDLTAMLAKADAALLAGNDLFRLGGEHRKFDLVEEWSDLTGLPYVHGFWTWTPDSMTAAERGALRDARTAGLQNLPSLPASHSALESPEGYFERFSYELDDETLDSISEFFRYAFYYSILSDIPEIRIEPAENETLSLPRN